MNNNNNNKKQSMRVLTKMMAREPPATPRTMPLPSIGLTTGSVGCMIGVPESIKKSAIVDRFRFESSMW
jgi:hypothetical protein